MRTTCCLALCAACAAGWGNESYVHWRGGSLYPASDSEHIVMESERVTITMKAQQYTIDAEFVFLNEGDDATVTMGFPVSSGGVLFEEGLLNGHGIEDFRTWVDDKQVAFAQESSTLSYSTTQGDTTLYGAEEIAEFKRRLANRQINETVHTVHEDTWYSKDVSMAKGATVRTRVCYEAKYGAESNDKYLSASYVYGSGRSWKGPIGHAEFAINVSPDIWMVNYPRVAHDAKWSRRGEYGYVLQMEDLEPEKNDKLDFTLSREYPPYLSDFGLLQSDFVFSDDVLALCNIKHLRRFKHYVQVTRQRLEIEGGDKRAEGQQDDAIQTFSRLQAQNMQTIKNYLETVSKNHFVHAIHPVP